MPRTGRLTRNPEFRHNAGANGNVSVVKYTLTVRRPRAKEGHSLGTLLYDASQNVKTVQDIMGHSDFKTTIDRYVHPVEARKQSSMQKVNSLIAPWSDHALHTSAGFPGFESSVNSLSPEQEKSVRF